MATPRVSVCITAYNHERYITQAVESALMQRTSFPVEVVIGEDCSTDGTRQLLQAMRARHSDRIRLLCHSENIGAYENTVVTRGACRGEYIAHLDGDDYWVSADKLQRQVDFMESHPCVSVCGHRVLHEFENTGMVDYSAKCTPRQKEVGTLGDVLRCNYLPASSVLFVRKHLDAMPSWARTTRACDWLLVILLARHGKVGFVNDVLGCYRIHKDGVWSQATRVERMLGQVELVRNLNRHFGYRYLHILLPVLAEFHMRLSRAYYREGDLGRARRAFLLSVLSWPSIRRLSVHSLVDTVDRCVPGFRDACSRWIRRIGLRAD